MKSILKNGSLRAVAAFATVVAMVFIASVLFTSCDNDVDNGIIPVEETATIQNMKEEISTRAGSGNYYGIDNNILQWFVHYCQKDANLPDASNACCPTSYMMAAACLAHYKDGYNTQYNANESKLSGLISGFKGYNTTNNPNRWKSIITARDYCNAYDGSWLTAKYLSPTDRSEAKTQIETWLRQDKFVMIPLLVRTNSSSIVNQSSLYTTNSDNRDLSSVSHSDNYIKTFSGSGIGGHVILIIEINKNDNSNEGGIVTYIDPLAQTKSTSNRRYVSYKRLLDSILASSQSQGGSTYNMTAVYLK